MLRQAFSNPFKHLLVSNLGFLAVAVINFVFLYFKK